MWRLRIFSLLVLAGFARGAERPNVLFVAVDDLNTRLGCYGFERVHSPRIDELAGRGVRFDRAYCQYPSCGPSRASVLTGLRPETTGVLYNRMEFRDRVPDVRTLPQVFRDHGYRAVRVGKIYHQAVPTDIGTSGQDDEASWDAVVNPRGRDKDEEDLLTVYTPELPLPDQMAYLEAEGGDAEQTDGKVAREAVRLLGEFGDDPFFLAVGFYRPHIPYIAPKPWFDRFDIEETKLPALPAGYRDRVPGAALLSTPVWPNFGTTEREARECRLAYDACVSFVDAQVGVLLEGLERHGLAGNTIVVLWGDHGYHLGEHGLWRKNSLYEESVRAPLVIAGPGVTEGGVCPGPVEFVDIYPTVLDLAGLPLPEYGAGEKAHRPEGVSLRPLLEDPSSEWDRPAFSQVMFTEIPGRMIRTARWKYVEWGEQGARGVELYDERKDPDELTNLAGSEAHEEIEAELRGRLRKQFRR